MRTSRVKSELKQLPLMLGKLLGGITATTGLTMASVIGVRKAGSTFADIFPFLLLGGAGIALFVTMSRLLTKRQNGGDTSMSDAGTRESMVSWGILLMLASVVLLCVYLITR